MISEREFQQQLASLNAEFSVSLPEKIAEIETCWANLEQRPARREHRNARSHSSKEEGRAPARQSEAQRDRQVELKRELHRALHSLAGSAQLFGFPALGEAARRAEAALASRDAGAAKLVREEMQRALKIMRTHVAAEVHRPSDCRSSSLLRH